jgi:SAM-dependent methyltransferase
MESIAHEAGFSMNPPAGNALTGAGDWTRYYSDRQFEQIRRTARRSSAIDDFLARRRGRIFELGCGGSPLLARSALLGWEVGGIDFNADALELIRAVLMRDGHGCEDLVHGDAFSYDTSRFDGRYDALLSFGFLEHFRNPEILLAKWKSVLNDGGSVVSIIPNLFSVNSVLMRRFDPEFWAQHVRYSPRDMDRFHGDAGLEPVRKARFCGIYDIHMLIPWARIRQRIGEGFGFKTVKYLSYFGIGKLLGLLPASGLRPFNSFVMGIYAPSARQAPEAGGFSLSGRCAFPQKGIL